MKPLPAAARVRWSAALLAAAALTAGTAAPARAETVAGVEYAPLARVAGQALQLNGAGVRYKFVVPVYTAGLYLSARAVDTDGVLRATGPKRLHIVMLRSINATELGKLFTRGMEENSSRADFARSISGTLRLAELFAAKRKLDVGEHFTVEWWPDKGTQILVNGQPQGAPIPEPEFFAALMRIWLGPHPADALLKDRLLGHAGKPAGSVFDQGG